MSNSEGDSQDNQQETMEYYCIPRKFVFDVPESDDLQENQHKRVLKKSLEAEKYMPFIFNFPEPANYKEGYSQLVKQVIGIYNHIRLLIVEEYYEELKHVVRELKIEQPGDCLTMLKELFSGCCEKMQARPRDDNETSTSDYEELLQKAEAKIRILIRNEQIFRLNFDILSQKCEDAEKVINAGNQEVEAHKKVQEALTKENQELLAKLSQKDEEIKKAFKQRDLVERKLKEATDNLNALDTLDQATSSEQKNIAPAWNHHLLNMLIKENKTTPSDSSRPPSNFDSKSWNGARQQSSTRMTPTDSKMKVEKKTGPSVPVNAANASYLSNSSGNLNKAQVDRLKNSLVAEFKKHMNASINTNSNRAVLNASLDVMLNKSTENSHSHSQERTSVSGMLSSKKRNSQQIKTGQSQDQIRVKPPTKERKLGEYSEKDSLPYTANKSALQKIMNSGNKYGNNSTRPTSTGKSRESPLVSRSRIVQTEQSPDNKSQESRILHTYASNQSTDMIGSYAKKKSVDSRNKATAKSSMMIKNMIAEHLNKKLGHKAI